VSGKPVNVTLMCYPDLTFSTVWLVAVAGGVDGQNPYVTAEEEKYMGLRA
jgi:hypothetical protein